MKILLCTDGSSHASQGLNMGVRIAQRAASAVDILVVDERNREKKARQMAEAAAADLEADGIPVTIHRRTGQVAEELIHQARTVPYDLAVIGSRGRRGIARLMLGSVALHVSERAPVSVLVVKEDVRALERFLVCSSAGPVSAHTIQFAGRLAREINASVTLLHVMSQVPLAEDAFPDDLEASAKELIQRKSREGIHLDQMLALLTAEGIATRAVVRHGLVRDEIIAEGQEGRYDLLVIGTHVTPGLNSHLVNDLSADILLAADRPVLVVRYSQTEQDSHATGDEWKAND
ncbi:MAG: universal stress protein [Chloroflexota bacterium]|nr:universal stress protein [Chloroflexota bacterium]